jgi:wyosine [tRNA(Phe)-imidazoG37] synthetase (radical SAM superfamily)
MSFLPDLNPLIQQIKEFNQNQLVTNQLLTEILKEIKSDKLKSQK